MMQMQRQIGLLPLQYTDHKLLLVDQRKLPQILSYFDATSFEDVCFAIKDMVVRGAPSIGVTAAFGLALEAQRQAREAASPEDFIARVSAAGAVLNATRPTAVNLRWGVERVMAVLLGSIKKSLQSHCGAGSAPATAAALALEDAAKILEEHIESNRAIGDFGSKLLPDQCQVITHCNAGSLATCGWGTALGVIRSAHFAGKNISVFVDETRPRNQGANLTMWELTEDKIPATLVCDNMSGHIMLTKKIDGIIVGADRIALNGDTANKIGTYNLAVLARYHKVPFYVAAPISTFDAAIDDGSMIPIEERSSEEITSFMGRPNTVAGARAYNPAFDVTPAELISAIITERGVLTAPYRENIRRVLADNFVFSE